MSNMEETEKKTSSLYNSITERVNKLNLSDLQNKDNELDKSKLTQVILEIVNKSADSGITGEDIQQLKHRIETQASAIQKSDTEIDKLNAIILELKDKISEIEEKKKALNANAMTFIPRATSKPRTLAKTDSISDGEDGSGDAPHMSGLLAPLTKVIGKAIVCSSEDTKVRDDLCTIVIGKMLDFTSVESNLTASNVTEILNCFVRLGTPTSNYRFNCATILVKLCNSTLVKFGEKTFLEHLITYCIELFKAKIEFIRNNEFAASAYDCVLFFTELFLQLLPDNKLSTQDLVFNLKNCMKLLLEKDIGSMKCLVNIIKLSGKMLYEVEDLFGEQEFSMDTLFDNTKKAIVTKQSIDRCTRRMLMSIIELRAAEWGEDRGPLNKEFIPVQQAPPHEGAAGDAGQSGVGDSLMNPNALNSSGLPKFLAQNGLPDMSGDEIQYLMNNYLDDEFDEEMMEAFEIFQAQN